MVTLRLVRTGSYIVCNSQGQVTQVRQFEALRSGRAVANPWWSPSAYPKDGPKSAKGKSAKRLAGDRCFARQSHATAAVVWPRGGKYLDLTLLGLLNAPA